MLLRHWEGHHDTRAFDEVGERIKRSKLHSGGRHPLSFQYCSVIVGRKVKTPWYSSISAVPSGFLFLNDFFASSNK